MCLAVPLRISSADGVNAVGEVEGIKRNIRIDFLRDVKVGDYVIVHAGFAIEKLKPSQAEENLNAILEVAKSARSGV